MFINDGGGGGSSGDAARRAAEEAARRAREEAARKAAADAARQAAADEAAEEAFRRRQAQQTAQSSQTTPAQTAPVTATAPVDAVETSPAPNRFTKDDVYTPPASAASDAGTYRVDPNGQLVADASPTTTSGPVRDDWYNDPSFNQPAATSTTPAPVTQQLQQQYDALSPAEQAQITRADFVAQGTAEYQAATAAHGQAVQNVDAQITAALDEGGPNSREAQILQSQRDRLIASQTRTAVQDFRDTRDADALAEQYRQDPERWAQVAAQYNIDPERQPTPTVIKEILQTSRAADEQAGIAGQIAVNNLGANATAADAEAARQRAAAESRLNSLLDAGLTAAPEGVDPKQWVASQGQLAGETARVQQLAIQNGQDPMVAAQQSEALFDLRLEASLQGAPPDGATPEQIAAYKDEQRTQFREAVDLANRNGISMDDAQKRIADAHALQNLRIGAQLKINAEVEHYDAATTAVQRGGEAIRGWVYGDGVNHLDAIQQEFGQIEALEQQYNRLLLKGDGPLTQAQSQDLAALRQQIEGRINLATTNAGLNVKASLDQAGRYRPVESALFQAIYAGSSVLPGGVVVGASVKLLLDDLPNGRIRTNGNVLETGQDVVLSMAVGGANVAVGKFDPTKGGTTTLLRAGANPILEQAARIGLDGTLNALVAGGSSVADQLHDPNREGKGIDWQQVESNAVAALGGSIIGGTMGASMPVKPTNVMGAIVRDTATGFTSASIIDASVQLATTGHVDPLRSVGAGLESAATSGLIGHAMATGRANEALAAQAIAARAIAAPETPVAPRPTAEAPGAPGDVAQLNMFDEATWKRLERPPLSGEPAVATAPEAGTPPPLSSSDDLMRAIQQRSEPFLDNKAVYLTNLDEYEVRSILRTEGGWVEGAQTAPGYRGQPKWTKTIDGNNHEIRMHPTATRTNPNIREGMAAHEGAVSRYGVEVVPGGMRRLPQDWKPGDPIPAEVQPLYDVDNRLRGLYGDQPNPMPRWGLHYVDPFGYTYVNERGSLVGVASEHGHAFGKSHPGLGDEPWTQSPYQPEFHRLNPDWEPPAPLRDQWPTTSPQANMFDEATWNGLAAPGRAGDPNNSYVIVAGRDPLVLPMMAGPRAPEEFRAPALLNADGKPVATARAADYLPALLTDPRTPLPLHDGDGPAPTLSTLAAEPNVSYFTAYYNGGDGTVRVSRTAVGDASGVTVSPEAITGGARDGETPIAGFYNRPSGLPAPSAKDFAAEGSLFAGMKTRTGREFPTYILRNDEGRPVVTEFGGHPVAVDGVDTNRLRFGDTPIDPRWAEAHEQVIDSAARALSGALGLPPDQLPPERRRQLLQTLDRLYTQFGSAIARSDKGQLTPADRGGLDTLLQAAQTDFSSELLASASLYNYRHQVATGSATGPIDFLRRVTSVPGMSSSSASFLEKVGGTQIVGIGQSGTVLASLYAERAQEGGWRGQLGYLVPTTRKPNGAASDFAFTLPSGSVHEGDSIVLVDDLINMGYTKSAVEGYFKEHETFGPMLRDGKLDLYWVAGGSPDYSFMQAIGVDDAYILPKGRFRQPPPSDRQ